MLFIQCYKSVFEFSQEVALTADYTNPKIIVTFADLQEGGDTWGDEAEQKIDIMTKDEFDDMMKKSDPAAQSNDTPADAPEGKEDKA